VFTEPIDDLAKEVGLLFRCPVAFGWDADQGGSHAVGIEPGGVDCSRKKLTSRRPEPISRTTDSATSTTTSKARKASAPDAARLTPGRGILEHLGKIGSRGLPRRNQSDEHRAGDAHQHGETEGRGVDLEGGAGGGEIRRQSLDGIQRHIATMMPSNADTPEKSRLSSRIGGSIADEWLRVTTGSDLPLAGGETAEEEIGNVGAGDEQHQGHHGR
jgi:hypothetical protein